MQVPTNGVGSFLNDYTLRDLQPSKTRDMICQQCDENNKAVSYCKTCSDYFCDSCQQAHKRLKLFQRHITVNITDTETASDIRLKCTIHSNEQLKVYCQTCHTLACIHCFVASHNGHAVEGINDAARRKAGNAIEENRRNLHSNLEKLQEDLQCIEAIEKLKEGESTQLKADINKRVDSMIALLEDRRAKLVKEVDDTYTKYFKELWVEREHLQTVITSMEGALQFSKRVLDCKDDTRILLLSSQVMTSLKELSRRKWDNSQADTIERNSLKWNESTSVQMYAPSKHDCTKQISDIELVGNVQTHYQAMSKITLTLQNVPQKVEWGQQVEFQVTATTIPLRALKSVKIESSIRYTTKQTQYRSSEDEFCLAREFPLLPDSQVTACTNEPDETRNHWTVRFTPAEQGTCYISLRASAVSEVGRFKKLLSKNTNTHHIQVVPL